MVFINVFPQSVLSYFIQNFDVDDQEHFYLFHLVSSRLVSYLHAASRLRFPFVSSWLQIIFGRARLLVGVGGWTVMWVRQQSIVHDSRSRDPPHPSFGAFGVFFLHDRPSDQGE